jgi:type IV secretion system protein VirB10
MEWIKKLGGKKAKVSRQEPGDDGLPEMEAAPSTMADAVKAAHYNPKEFRARENAEVAAAENEGLPSVNRRKGGNKLVTLLGIVFIVAVGATLLVAVNGKGPKKEKGAPKAEKIANNLPPLVMPPAPAPVAAPGSSPAIPLAGNSGAPNQAGNGSVPAVQPGQAQPIGVKGGPGTGPGKAPLDWTDRKMVGALLVGSQQNGAAGGGQRYQDGGGAQSPAAMKAQQAQLDRLAQVQANSGGGGGGPRGFMGGGDDDGNLGVKLEPTMTRGVAAAMLPDRNFVIAKGTSLDCALETALDSSVPGITTCRLTRDVYSDNGQVVLLERGSQLVGEYKGKLKQGQVRLFVLWTRAKTPNGVIVNLNSPGTDMLGRSGLEGFVDNHFWERFGAAILMSLISDSVSASMKNSGSGNYYAGTANSGSKVVEKMLESTVGIPPTIVKNQGEHIQVMVARDLDFSGVYALAPGR